MKMKILTALGAATLVTLAIAPAQAATMKECAAQWQQMKTANQTAGKTYKDFSKTCMSGSASDAKPAAAAPAAAPAPAAAAAKPAAPAAAAKPAATTAAAKPAATTPAAKPVSEGRAAELERQRACGAEWKADKAAGKIQAGMKWPQYWSACNTRKKASAT